jgi:uncharacterized membrane protein
MAYVVSTFLRGLGVVAPLALTAWLVWWLADGAESLLREGLLLVMPADLYHPGMGVLLAVVFVFSVGVLLQVFFIERFWNWLESFVDRIPLVKTIFGLTRDFTGFFSPGPTSGPRTVVRVDLGTDAQLIGFVTDDSSRTLARLGADLVAVYLPMSYQLGGYTVLVPRDRVRALDWTMDEAMRFVLTAGIRRGGDAS